jgi:hypothetical protein
VAELAQQRSSRTLLPSPLPVPLPVPVPLEMENMNGVGDEYHWIAGNDSSVCHECLIDSGSFGRVHEVHGTSKSRFNK